MASKHFLYLNFILISIVFNSFIQVKGQYNDFASFANANATLAVIIDEEYRSSQFFIQDRANLMENFQKIFNEVVKNHLKIKGGGINVRYFTWKEIRVKYNDVLAAITIMNCENTWNFFRGNQKASILLISLTDAECPRLPMQQSVMVPSVQLNKEFPQLVLDAKMQNVLRWNTAIVIMDESWAQENYALLKLLMYENQKKNGIQSIAIYFYTIEDIPKKDNDQYSIDENISFKDNNGQNIKDKKGVQQRTPTPQRPKIRLNIRRILKLFHKPIRYQQQFLIFSQFYEDIIELADSMNMFHINNQWLFFILNDINQEKSTTESEFDPMILTQNLQEGTNIAFVLNDTNPNCEQTIECTIRELSTAFIISLAKLMVSEESVHNQISEEEWEAIRFTKLEKLYEIRSTMIEYLRTNMQCASCTRWRLITALNWGKSQQNKKYPKTSNENANRNYEFANVGYWTPTLGFITEELLFPHIQHFFRNLSLNVVTISNPPWQILKKNVNGEITQHDGITMEVLKMLSVMLNFTYSLQDAQEPNIVNRKHDFVEGNGEHSSNSNNKSITSESQTTNDDLSGSLTFQIPSAVTEMVKNKKYFLAAVAATIDDPEKKSFNFTIPISRQKYAFITRTPEEVSRIYLFTAPFKRETWLALIVSLIITSPALYWLNRLVAVKEMKVHDFNTMKDCFWYVGGALLQQGGLSNPQADSTRLLIGLWWITVIVLVTSYCGNLVAFLTFPRYEPTLNYLFQLFENEKHQPQQYREELGLRNGTLFEKYSMISQRSDLHTFVNNAIIYNNEEQQNINAIRNGERINIDWEINLQLTIQNEFEKEKQCSFAIGKERFLDEQIALMVPENSPYLELINDRIYRLQQMGFLEKWHQLYLPAMDKCSGKNAAKQITNHKVDLDDMQGCFLILLLGFIVAFTAILLEYFYNRWHRKREEMQEKLFST